MKKIVNIIRLVFTWLLIALAVGMMIFTVVSVTTFNRNDRNLFGYRVYIVNTDSMSATHFDAGDLIFVKQINPAELNAGDVITYISQNSESYGENITHRIRRRAIDAEGNPGFITYGTTTDTDDATIVTYPYVMGKYQFKIAKVGMFFSFLKTTQGYIVCIFVPFMLLILYQGIKCIVLFRKYKGEQMEEMQEEKAKLEAERAENAKMLEEIKELKKQLESKNEDNKAEETATETSEEKE